MNLNDIPPELGKAVPGAVGSLFSLFWIKETWPRRLAMFLGGSALSMYGTDDAARLTGLNGGFTGFLLGLFGMAMAGKLFEAWGRLELGSIVGDWLRKIAGLPPKP